VRRQENFEKFWRKGERSEKIRRTRDIERNGEETEKKRRKKGEKMEKKWRKPIAVR